MKVTIENGEETKVWEDVEMVAGAIVVKEQTSVVKMVDSEISAFTAFVDHIYASRAIHKLLKKECFRTVSDLCDIANSQETEV